MKQEKSSIELQLKQQKELEKEKYEFIEGDKPD